MSTTLSVKVTPNLVCAGTTANIRIAGCPDATDIVLDGLVLEDSKKDGDAIAAKVCVPKGTEVGWRRISFRHGGNLESTEFGLYVSATEESREKFLLQFHTQAWKNIDTHIALVWQGITALASTVALLGLVEKKVISLDVAASLVVLVSSWVVLHALDAWEWFHRNLLIVGNIERQFLRPTDCNLIQPYFMSHRHPKQMLRQLQLQVRFAIGIAMVIVAVHFFERVLPGFKSNWDQFQCLRALPYLMTTAATWFIIKTRQTVIKSNESVIAMSPGLKMESVSQPFGPEHKTAS